MLFPLTKQKPPLNEILLLVFKRVLDINFEEGIERELGLHLVPN
jgi:hypothetical protein